MLTENVKTWDEHLLVFCLGFSCVLCSVSSFHIWTYTSICNSSAWISGRFFGEAWASWR